MIKLEHDPLNDGAHRAIKQVLISGTFVPGQVVVTRPLAETFEISTTPSCETLQRLVAEWILELQKNCAIEIPLLSTKRFTELVRVRCIIRDISQEAKSTAKKLSTVPAESRA